MPAPFEPARLGDESQQDVNYVPNEIQDSVKGGSALPGSAADESKSFAGTLAQPSAGFLGTRRVPDEDEK